MNRRIASALPSLPAWAAGIPASDVAVEKLLTTRFDGDRSGACVQAAVIDSG